MKRRVMMGKNVGMLILYLQGILLLIFGYILMKEMNHYYSVAPKQKTV